MTTTYVFGAGASRDAGYPLAPEMGRGLLEFMVGSSDPLIRASGEFVTDMFGESPNIEDVITELQSQIESLKNAKNPDDRTQRMRLGNRRAYLGVGLREWFREIRSSPAPSYAAFADRIVKPGDVIVTFNYDESLERELRRIGKWDISSGYGFPLGTAEDSSDVLMLKLHGSVNWLVSVLDGATGGAFIVDPISSLGNHPVIHRADLQFLGYESFSGHTYQSGGAFPCLILPGRTKEFFYDTSFGHEFSEFWDFLWSQAAEALNKTDRIVLCGYSLPGADQRARDLLLLGPDKEADVEIICGNQTERIATEFRRAGFRNVATFEGGYFADWCEANQVPQSPDKTLGIAGGVARCDHAGPGASPIRRTFIV
jgi:hypothetical protein